MQNKQIQRRQNIVGGYPTAYKSTPRAEFAYSVKHTRGVACGFCLLVFMRSALFLHPLYAQNLCLPITLIRGRLQIQELVAVAGLK